MADNLGTFETRLWRERMEVWRAECVLANAEDRYMQDTNGSVWHRVFDWHYKIIDNWKKGQSGYDRSN